MTNASTKALVSIYVLQYGLQYCKEKGRTMNKYINAEWLKQNLNLSFWSEIGKIINSAPSIDIDLANDGTLSVKIDDATKVSRVLVEDGKNGDLYYTDGTKMPKKRIDKPFRAVWLDDELNVIGIPQTTKTCNNCGTKTEMCYFCDAGCNMWTPQTERRSK